ncbi:hypothetical protein QBC38DRAFT_444496 [Podospora fimiseda]|uniref:Uncharacterized protein n=1 Tax=Podospora fimiseda TaxID=252190 RepID=A0AAN7BNG4_9PEZI|nr:hypothetical protein QBC38DRAFT_444496 [Podospora fimiseda]
MTPTPSQGPEPVPAERLKPSEQSPQVRPNEENDPKYIVNKPYYCDEKIYVAATNLPQAVEQEGHVYPEAKRTTSVITPISPLSSNDSTKKQKSKAVEKRKAREPFYKRKTAWFVIGGLIIVVMIIVALTVPLVVLQAREEARKGASEKVETLYTFQVVTLTVPASTADGTIFPAVSFTTTESVGPTTSHLEMSATISDSRPTTSAPVIRRGTRDRKAEPEPMMTPAPATPNKRRKRKGHHGGHSGSREPGYSSDFMPLGPSQWHSTVNSCLNQVVGNLNQDPVAQVSACISHFGAPEVITLTEPSPETFYTTYTETVPYTDIIIKTSTVWSTVVETDISQVEAAETEFTSTRVVTETVQATAPPITFLKKRDATKVKKRGRCKPKTILSSLEPTTTEAPNASPSACVDLVQYSSACYCIAAASDATSLLTVAPSAPTSTITSTLTNAALPSTNTVFVTLSTTSTTTNLLTTSPTKTIFTVLEQTTTATPPSLDL